MIICLLFSFSSRSAPLISYDFTVSKYDEFGTADVFLIVIGVT